MGRVIHVGRGCGQGMGTLLQSRELIGDCLNPVTSGIADWLRENQQTDGRVLDPMHREYGTYADGFAGLVFGLMAMRTGDSRWDAAGDRSLRVARQRPRESEFDQLALLL